MEKEKVKKYKAERIQEFKKKEREDISRNTIIFDEDTTGLTQQQIEDLKRSKGIGSVKQPIITNKDCIDFPNEEVMPNYIIRGRNKLYFFSESGLFTQKLSRREVNMCAKHIARTDEEKEQIYKQYDEETGIMKTAFKSMHEYRKEFLEQDIRNEILGYPEFSEKYFKIHRANRQEIDMKFKNYNYFLRLMLSNKPTYERIIASLCATNNMEYYEQFRNLFEQPSIYKWPDKRNIILCKTNNYVKEHHHLPTLRTFCETILEVRYVEKVFNEWVLVGEDLDNAMESILIDYKKRISGQLVWFYKQDKDEIHRRNEIKRIANVLDMSFIPQHNKVNVFDNLEEDYLNENNGMIIKTGIKDLDDRQLYLQKGKLAILTGHVGSFKTTFALNITYNLLKSGLNVAYFWLEDCERSIYYNLLSKHSNDPKFTTKISHNDIKKKNLNEDDRKYLFETIYEDFKRELKPHLAVILSEDLENNKGIKLDNVLEKANKQFIETTGKGIDVIIVDNVNLMKYNDNIGNNDYACINHYVKYCETISKNFLNKGNEVAMLCLSQLSREGLKKAQANNGKINLTDIAESNEIDRSANLILGIFKGKNIGQNNKIRISVVKSRDDETEESFDIDIDPKYYNILNNKGSKDIKNNQQTQTKTKRNMFTDMKEDFELNKKDKKSVKISMGKE